MTTVNNQIKLKWISKGEKHEKMLNREEVLAVFQGLVKGFVEDNEISEKMVKILPEVDWLKIDQDHNDTQEIPCLIYSVNGSIGILKIIRYHKIVWSILNKYCTD